MVMLLLQDLLFVDFRGSVFKCNCGQTEGTNIVLAYSLWETFGQLQKWICLFISAATSPTASEPERPGKLKAFKNLDALGMSLLQQSLLSSCKLGSQFAIDNSMYTFFIAFCLNLNFISNLCFKQFVYIINVH